MRKFAAHYLVSDGGVFLKNGMALGEENGIIAQYIDTTGDLKEVEQLVFHNGILMAGFMLTKNHAIQPVWVPEKAFRSLVIESTAGLLQLSIQNFIDLGKQLQDQFPGMKIPAIMNEIWEVLLAEGGFEKRTMPELYLLTGVDLVELHFTPKSRLKKIF